MRSLIYKTFPFLLALPLAVFANGVQADCGNFGTGMMGWMGGMGYGGLWFWLAPFITLVWLTAGVLLIVYLWQKINKK